MNRFKLAAAASLLVLTGLGWLLFKPAPEKGVSVPVADAPPSSAPLMVYCAASNRPVMEALSADWRQRTGQQVEVQYGPSQGLLSSIELSRTGDIYLPADDSYIHLAQQKGMLGEVRPLARMRAVVAVKKENPLKIARFEDLLSPQVRLVQANPDLAAIGLLTRETLTPLGKWEPLARKTVVFRTNVNEAANDVLAGAADAAISYDVVARAMPGLAALEIDELKNVEAQVVAGVLSFSTDTPGALRFLTYLQSAEGQARYREFGFLPPPAIPTTGAQP